MRRGRAEDQLLAQRHEELMHEARRREAESDDDDGSAPASQVRACIRQ